MKLSAIQEDVSVVNVWHQMSKDINNACMEHFLLSYFG